MVVEKQRWQIVLWCICLGLGAASCGVCSNADEFVQTEGDVPKREQVVRLEGEIPLTIPPAAQYATEGKVSKLDQTIIRVLKDSPSGAGYDTCLARAAGEYARHLPVKREGEEERKVPSALQTAVLHRAGCTEGWVASHYYFTNASSTAGFLEHLKSILKELPKPQNQEELSIGVGRARAQDPYRWTYVVFSTLRKAVLDPIPREVRSGASVQFSGILLGDLEDAQVLLLAPGGDVETMRVREEDSGAFSSDVVVSETPGEYWIELLAAGHQGPQVVALFPIYVGQKAPDTVLLEAAPDESSIDTTHDAERLMLRLLNKDRQQFRLAPLVWDEELAEIARGHSEDMASNDFFAHVSPTRGTLKDRFARGRYAAYSMGENISRNDSVYDAEQGLMQSLGHRVNILSPTFTHVGVGVSFRRDEYGRRIMHLTQNFSRPQRRLRGIQARDEVVRRLNRLRKKRGLQTLVLDETLQEVAARLARFGGGEGGYDAEAMTKRVQSALQERGYRYRSFSIQMHTVLDPNDVQLPSGAVDRAMTRVGVGVFPDRSQIETQWRTLLVLVRPW